MRAASFRAHVTAGGSRLDALLLFRSQMWFRYALVYKLHLVFWKFFAKQEECRFELTLILEKTDKVKQTFESPAQVG
jgi:hypothetical protein